MHGITAQRIGVPVNRLLFGAVLATASAIATCLAGPAGADASATPVAPAVADNVSDRGAQALAWARNQMASDPDNPVQCEVFVEQAYNHSFRYDSAMEAFNDLKAKGKIFTNTNGIPAGALVFTSDPRVDAGNGHVMLSQGDGSYLTANFSVAPKIRVVPLAQNRFLGWAYAP